MDSGCDVRYEYYTGRVSGRLDIQVPDTIGDLLILSFTGNHGNSGEVGAMSPTTLPHTLSRNGISVPVTGSD